MHVPVLLEEVLEFLSPRPGNVIMDGTGGGGGHSEEILKRIAPDGRLILVDRDKEAVQRLSEKFDHIKDIVTVVNDDFRNLEDIKQKAGVEKLDGAMFDLGMSSFQIDDPERGFSFLSEGPLDMRFDHAQHLSARVVVNTFSKDELVDIIRNYGEERHANRISAAICYARKKGRIETTTELAEIIDRSVGRWYRNQKLHSAVRTFQGLRIYVNDELAAVEEGVKKAVDSLSEGGRICVISFHSLEDRIIKNIFRDAAKAGVLKVLTKKPICPNIEEVRMNSRARSSKLRAAEKIR